MTSGIQVREVQPILSTNTINHILNFRNQASLWNSTVKCCTVVILQRYPTCWDSHWSYTDNCDENCCAVLLTSLCSSTFLLKIFIQILWSHFARTGQKVLHPSSEGHTALGYLAEAVVRYLHPRLRYNGGLTNIRYHICKTCSIKSVFLPFV